MSWIETQDVLDVLGLDQTGTVLDMCIAASEAQVPTWRDDIHVWELVKDANPNVYLAGVQFAALIYQENVTPEGFAGFDEAGGLLFPPSSKQTAIRHLARANRPKVG